MRWTPPPPSHSNHCSHYTDRYWIHLIQIHLILIQIISNRVLKTSENKRDMVVRENRDNENTGYVRKPKVTNTIIGFSVLKQNETTKTKTKQNNTNKNLPPWPCISQSVRTWGCLFQLPSIWLPVFLFVFLVPLTAYVPPSSTFLI